MIATRSSHPLAPACRGMLRWGPVSLAVAAVVVFSVAEAAAPPARGGKDEPPKPEEIGGAELTTRDGVQLKATFSPSNKGKEAVPVILLHSYKGSRKEYVGLADLLHKSGHAVLVPDLRGHGDSTTQYFGPGRTQELDASKFRTDDFARMVSYDMETLKAFLIKRNNAGELNIEKLCVVGGEMGASVALDWARLDWSWPVLVGKKQGQDVKALVLISPELNFRGHDVRPALSHPAVQRQLSMLIIVGNDDSRAVAEARRLEGMLSRYHPKPDDLKQQDFFFARLGTKLQGTQMLGVQGINVEGGILNFIELRLVEREFPWNIRE